MPISFCTFLFSSNWLKSASETSSCWTGRKFYLSVLDHYPVTLKYPRLCPWPRVLCITKESESQHIQVHASYQWYNTFPVPNHKALSGPVAVLLGALLKKQKSWPTLGAAGLASTGPTCSHLLWDLAPSKTAATVPHAQVHQFLHFTSDQPFKNNQRFCLPACN